MLSKIKGLRHLGSQVDWSTCRGHGLPMNGVCDFLCNSICNVSVLTKAYDSTKDAESPDLPCWIKFSEDPTITNPEDDFVLPSISYWVDNHKIYDKEANVKGVSTLDNGVDKISRILKNQFESPDSVSQVLNGCDVNLSESLVLQVLKRFSNAWKPAFEFFNWAKLQSGLIIPPSSYDLMVDSLGKSKNFDLMWELVEEMDRLGGYITLVTMGKVFRRLAKGGRYEEAIQAFKKMERFGVKKDVAALNFLMDALMKGRSVEHAQEVYLEFKNQILPNLQTFNILIHGFCKARQFDKAKIIMEEMKSHGVSPDVVSYTSLIEAYSHDKDFRKVDTILEEMQEKGCPPNTVTYTIIMLALGKAKQSKEALEVYNKMKQNNCVPDSLFYSSLIYILSKDGRLKDARALFEDMPRQGITPGVLAYTTMITIACQHSEEENALKLFQKMEENQCKPDIETYIPLLKMCCRMKRMKVLSFLLSHMFNNDISIDLGTYSLLVTGLCKHGKLEHACSFFEEMVLKGFVPRESTYEMLVKELDKKGMGKAKERIAELMAQSKLQGCSHSSFGDNRAWEH
ncbi:hypothetical protein RJ640_011435 [Escallonia rubra]|uniref:PROP1-like PPR domain-containing protein n=1 Tax=Escallonia rubra TaxID=112253 RepID=A0AA88UME7_9ASTE|nr:hypothetical protein RJ640_011435 [Escallonia rubra]